MTSRNETYTGARSRESIRFILLVATATVFFIGSSYAQTPGQPAVIRQVPAPLPKLALNGAVGETNGGVQFHRIVLMITNWERYSSEMFLVPTGRKLPPNPCAEVKTRVAITVYSERGTPLASCIAMPKPVDLGKFSFLIQKGKSVPDFVYAVILDRHTGGVYRSNLVSPWNGSAK